MLSIDTTSWHFLSQDDCPMKYQSLFRSKSIVHRITVYLPTTYVSTALSGVHLFIFFSSLESFAFFVLLVVWLLSRVLASTLHAAVLSYYSTWLQNQGGVPGYQIKDSTGHMCHISDKMTRATICDNLSRPWGRYSNTSMRLTLRQVTLRYTVRSFI